MAFGKDIQAMEKSRACMAPDPGPGEVQGVTRAMNEYPSQRTSVPGVR
jgi:hypothetical protein